MQIQKFYDLAHRQYMKLEQEICTVLQIKPLAKLATSFATNVIYLFENQLYPFYWTRKEEDEAFVFPSSDFFGKWCKKVRENSQVRNLRVILGKDETNPDKCHRSQCYYNLKNEGRCICGDLLAPGSSS